jgi:hypothetical protein
MKLKRKYYAKKGETGDFSSSDLYKTEVTLKSRQVMITNFQKIGSIYFYCLLIPNIFVAERKANPV